MSAGPILGAVAGALDLELYAGRRLDPHEPPFVPVTILAWRELPGPSWPTLQLLIAAQLHEPRRLLPGQAFWCDADKVRVGQ